MGTRRYAFAAVVVLLLLLWFSQLLVPLFTAPLLTGDIVPVRREIKTARHATLLDTAAGSLSGQHVLVTGGAGSHRLARIAEATGGGDSNNYLRQPFSRQQGCSHGGQSCGRPNGSPCRHGPIR